KASQNAADEPRTEICRQQATDHAGSNTGTVSDGIGDITSQYRDHQLEGSASTDLHQGGSQGALFLESLDTEDKRQSDQQATSHHHGQHEGHPGQQVLVDALFLEALGGLGPPASLVCGARIFHLSFSSSSLYGLT